MVVVSTHLSLFNIRSAKVASKMATKNTLDTNLAITMFYNLQNASFMHISSPVNALEDDYGTLRHFVKIKVASRMVDSRFIIEMPYFFFSRFAFFFFFFFFCWIFGGSDLHLLAKWLILVQICHWLRVWSELVASKMGRLNWNGHWKGLTITKYQTKWVLLCITSRAMLRYLF